MAGSVSIWKIYGFPKASFYQERSVPRHATAYIHKRCKQCFSRTFAEGFFKILSVFFLNILSKSFVDNCSFKIL